MSFFKPATITATAMIAASMLLVSVAMVDAGSTVLSVHGSGTTNPSKCYWAIMEQIMVQTRHPTRLTYRAIGSSTGIQEFLAPNGIVDFASGDLPLSAADYNEIVVNQGNEIVQLPVLLGAVNFFHNVPLLNDAANSKVTNHLNMTACLLARIFNRQITNWNDEGIRQLNPNMDIDDNDDFPITVARRDKGSSSTDSITNYLHGACPSEWPADMVGPELTNWHNETTICEGSAGMTSCIVDIIGAIGYMDAGHGLAADLNEVALEKQIENSAGAISTFFLTSSQAAAQNGIAAAENGVFPNTTDVDMSSVSLLNRPGEYTWPIVQMTYIYVRKDLTKVLPNDVAEQALLVAFLTALFGEDFEDNDSQFIQQCIDEYGFIRPSATVIQLARNGVKMLITNATTTGNVTTPAFMFESSTTAVDGAGDLVVSVKRSQIADVERASLMDNVDELKGNVIPELKRQLDIARVDIVLLKEQLNQLTGGVLGNGGGDIGSGSDTTAAADDEASTTTPNLRADTASAESSSSSTTDTGRLFTPEDESQLKASLILSSLSFVMWMIFIFYLGYKFITKA